MLRAVAALPRCFIGDLTVSGQPLGVHATRTDPVRVLEEMKRLAVEQLGAIPGALYRPVEQALQSPSASAESFHDQAALLVLRQHSASHVMRFRQQIAQGFDEFRTPRIRDVALMGLIDEHLIDFHLAGQRLAEILDQRYQQPLDAMKHRLIGLAAALRLESAGNPISPARLADAFVETFGDAGLPEALAGLMFRQYQQELARVLDDLYERINTLLADAGYDAVGHYAAANRAAPAAPVRSPSSLDEQVAPRYPQPPAFNSANVPAEYAAHPAHPAHPAYSHAAPASAPMPAATQHVSAELAGLRAQLRAWRTTDAPHAPHAAPAPYGYHPHRPPPPRRELRVQEVVSIASLLQPEPPDAYARALTVSGRLAEAIRAHLTEGARRLGLNPEQTRFSVDEEDAIDLVALLFESLFRTHALQDRARRLYARLVLPYVKVALVNDAMFVQPEHPARRLLDAITEACEDNSAATPQDRELLERAAAVSQRVVAEYNEDLAVFELAHAELEDLLVQQRRRTELQETRAAKATHGRERLNEARSQADTVLQRRLTAPPLTSAVANFLVTPWRHHLVQTLLRDGAESVRLADAVQLGNALVEADRLAEAGRGRELADRLLALQPAIVECLASSGLDDGAARHGMAGLVRELANPDTPRALHAAPPSDVSDEPAEEGSRLWLAGGTDTIAHDPGVAALMRRLQPGEWLRLTDAHGEAVSVRVAWISPLTSRLLLVNRRGLRVLVAAPEELAVLVGAGRLLVGAERTPFNEAMRQLKDRLDYAVGQR
ncbi:DUF1631 family protein [Lysobacter koreensis]|uniref:DUF1631 family protein n=1 Tax=Lysobacter koreensis TaxID=266122 RepID=A0ABW2YQI0_9GAMM